MTCLIYEVGQPVFSEDLEVYCNINCAPDRIEVYQPKNLTNNPFGYDQRPDCLMYYPRKLNSDPGPPRLISIWYNRGNQTPVETRIGSLALTESQASRMRASAEAFENDRLGCLRDCHPFKDQLPPVEQYLVVSPESWRWVATGGGAYTVAAASVASPVKEDEKGTEDKKKKVVIVRPPGSAVAPMSSGLVCQGHLDIEYLKRSHGELPYRDEFMFRSSGRHRILGI